MATPWRSDLCDCGVGEFCYAFWCPPCAHVEVAQELDESSSAYLHALAWCCRPGIAVAVQREEIRRTYGIRGNCCEDVATACCCMPCAIAQQRREVRTRRVPTAQSMEHEPLSRQAASAS